MTKKKGFLFPKIESYIKTVMESPIARNRMPVLNDLINYIRNSKKEKAKLIFICTHNSRRSQFAQVWAQIASAYFNIPVRCYSGGVEVTACNKRTIASLKRSGFKVNVSDKDKENPVYQVFYADNVNPIQLFSKIFDDPVNPNKNFAAIMTCSDADKNCPFIPGAKARIPLNYNDPKEFDGTSEESVKYDERNMQIASEMFYVMSKVRQMLDFKL